MSAGKRASALPACSASGRGEQCMSELLVRILRRCMTYMASAPFAPGPRLARFANARSSSPFLGEGGRVGVRVLCISLEVRSDVAGPLHLPPPPFPSSAALSAVTGPPSSSTAIQCSRGLVCALNILLKRRTPRRCHLRTVSVSPE